MPCPDQSGCAFSEALRSAPALRVWQTFYCESGFDRCQRRKLLRAGSLVPANLMPNGTWLGGRPAPAGAGAKRP